MDRQPRLEPACPDNPIPGLDPEVYARWRATSLGQTTERLERRLMLELIGDVAGKRVLEIGCGDGALSVHLASNGAEMSAIDVSERMLDAASNRARDAGVTLALSRAAADSLPFADEAFDMVVAQTILCFVKDADPVFAEIARVLRPGGRLVIGELGRWSTWAAERRIRAWLGSKLWQRGYFRSPGELRGLASRAGLVPSEVRGAVFYPRLAAAARMLSPIDDRIGRTTTLGAAFLAMAATKPAR